MSESPPTTWKTVGALVGAGTLLGVAWLAPFSPLALSRADVAVGQGQPQAAVERYDAVARYGLLEYQREEALWRGAMVAAVDLDDDQGALKRLRRLLTLTPDSVHASAAWEQIGHLLVARDRPGASPGGSPDRSLDAAIAFGHSFRTAPDDPRAPKRLTRAARAYASAGKLDRSDRSWIRLAQTFPELEARGLIGQATNELLRDNVQEALALYEEAIPHANDANVRAVARLGAASCLERLGDLDEAIAALDGAELPAGVHDRRRTGIHARIEARGE